MKIRQGFVSNSSSSSFVIAGVKVSKSQIDQACEEAFDAIDQKFSIIYPGEGGAPDDSYIIGHSIASCEDWGLNYSEISGADTGKRIDDVQRTLSELNVEIQSNGIFCGTRPS